MLPVLGAAFHVRAVCFVAFRLAILVFSTVFAISGRHSVHKTPFVPFMLVVVVGLDLVVSPVFEMRDVRIVVLVV